MRGWCPIHDRVVDAPGAACPDCGTTLVPLAKDQHPPGPIVIVREEHPADEVAPSKAPEPVPRDPHQEPEDSPAPAEVGPAIIATAAALIVVGAFFLGAVVMRGRSPAPAATPKARGDYSVGIKRTGAGVVLRLDSFSQRGRDVVLHVSVPPQPGVDIGSITSAVVIPLTANGEPVGRFTLDLRTTTTGFIAAGRALNDARTPVTGIEIMTITQHVGGGVDVPLDLSGVWPASTGSAPRAKRVDVGEAAGDGRRFRLTGLVGWADRLEARFDVSGERQGWVYDERYAIIVAQDPPVDGTLFPDASGSTVRQVAFFGIKRSGGPALIRIAVEDLTIAGRWRWLFT